MSIYKITEPVPFDDGWATVGYGWRCPGCYKTNSFQQVEEGEFYTCKHCKVEFESCITTPEW